MSKAKKPKIYKLPLAEIYWSKIEKEAKRCGLDPEVWLENIIFEALEKLPKSDFEKGLKGTWFGLGTIEVEPQSLAVLSSIVQVNMSVSRLYITTPENPGAIESIGIDGLLFGTTTKSSNFKTMPAVIAALPFGAHVDGFLQPGLQVQLRVRNNTDEPVTVSAGFKALRE